LRELNAIATDGGLALIGATAGNPVASVEGHFFAIVVFFVPVCC